MRRFLAALFMSAFFSCFLASGAQAATIQASNCSQQAVQNAVNSANDGDTVQVPACQEGVTWTNGITIDLSSGKSLTLQGAGIGKTVITDGTGADRRAISVIAASGKLFRLTGFTFVGSSTVDYSGLIAFSGSPSKIRIDHNRFHKMPNRTTFVNSDWGEVVFDNNVWDGDVYAGTLLVEGSLDASWRRPVNWGGSDFVFFENNTFDFSFVNNEGGPDCRNGGKYVFRHNTVINFVVGNHGFDSSARSCMAMEVYNNKFSSPAGPLFPAYIQMRGGTALIHDNVFQSGSSGVGVTNYRSQSKAIQYVPWRGFADGTQWKTCTNPGGQGVIACTSDADCAPYSGAGLCTHHWCSVTKDQRCASNSDCPGGETCSGYLDGSGTHGYPPRDVIGRGTNQGSFPVYQWNNLGDASIFVYSSYGGTDYSGDHIQSGRDYYNGVSYSYTTYTYPHPLTLSDQQTCSPLGGTPCQSGQTCSGGNFTYSSDYGSLCCVGGSCQSSSQYLLSEQTIEAESGALSGMQTHTSGYIYTGTYNTGSASYIFQIQDAGRYYMQARVNSNNDAASNSFYIILDGEASQGNNYYAYDTDLTDGFAWDNVSMRGQGTSSDQFDPMIWDLTQGTHNFTFYGRESNTWLDQIILRKACHKSDSDCSGCVSQPELMGFISRWYINNQDVTLKDLIEAIGLWKRGGCS